LSTLEFWQQVETAITNILNARTGQFIGYGATMYFWLGVLAIGWWAVETVRTRRGDWDPLGLVKLVFMLSLGWVMLQWYQTPIPGTGMSFTGIITNETQQLSSVISFSSIDQMNAALGDLLSRFETPGWTNVAACIMYGIIILVVGAVGLAAFAVILLGFVATAVQMLLGPIFIPFLIFPKMEWMFWGWLKSFIQYSFFRVFAAAVVYIFSNAIVAFVNSFPSSIPVGSMMVNMFEIILALGASIVCILYIPAMCSSTFSGSADGVRLKFW